MSTLKILLTGASGLLGQYVYKELIKHYDVLPLVHQGYNNLFQKHAVVDLSDFSQIEKVFDDYNPDVVIHLAAISRPEQAASMGAKLVNKINVGATKLLAELCEKNKSYLIYTSTDLVYAGYRGSMLTEDSKIIPVSLYAETKLMGEIKIKETFDNYLILRTALLYGFGLNKRKCSFHLLYKSLKENKPFKVFYDQFRTPLYLPDAAALIKLAVEKRITNETLNFAGPERLTRKEMGLALCKAANLNEDLLIPISLNDVGPIPQVADVSLNTDKLKNYGLLANPIEHNLNSIFNS